MSVQLHDDARPRDRARLVSLIETIVETRFPEAVAWGLGMGLLAGIPAIICWAIATASLSWVVGGPDFGFRPEFDGGTLGVLCIGLGVLIVAAIAASIVLLVRIRHVNPRIVAVASYVGLTLPMLLVALTGVRT